MTSRMGPLFCLCDLLLTNVSCSHNNLSTLNKKHFRSHQLDGYHGRSLNKLQKQTLPLARSPSGKASRCEKQLFRTSLKKLESNASPFFAQSHSISYMCLRAKYAQSPDKVLKPVSAQADSKGKEKGSICLSFWL